MIIETLYENPNVAFVIGSPPINTSVLPHKYHLDYDYEFIVAFKHNNNYLRYAPSLFYEMFTSGKIFGIDDNDHLNKMFQELKSLKEVLQNLVIPPLKDFIENSNYDINTFCQNVFIDKLTDWKTNTDYEDLRIKEWINQFCRKNSNKWLDRFGLTPDTFVNEIHQGEGTKATLAYIYTRYYLPDFVFKRYEDYIINTIKANVIVKDVIHE